MIVAGFTIAAIPLALMDFRTGRLPNWLVVVSHACTLSSALVAAFVRDDPGSLRTAGLGGIGFGLFYASLYLFLPGQLGGGDVKLSIPAGVALGWQSWSTVLTGLLLIWLAQAFAYAMARWTIPSRAAVILRHGPFLTIGTIAASVLNPGNL